MMASNWDRRAESQSARTQAQSAGHHGRRDVHQGPVAV